MSRVTPPLVTIQIVNPIDNQPTPLYPSGVYIHRTAEKSFRELIRQYPVVAVTGPRQSGKTTLVRHACPDKPYVLFEDLDVREFASADPRGFLQQYPDGAIFDEVQRCPEIFSYLQGIVDQDPRPGLFVLTGSQQFGLASGITQSLAGRAALLRLLPFSLSALEGADRMPESLDGLLYSGCYPPIHDRGYEPSTWYGNYVRTYIERDVRQLVNVRDLGQFQRFLRLCAGRTGQLVNLSSLAADCGLSHNTIRAWITVLEASYLIALLPPFHRNFNKRLVKTPKLYFLDPGLAAWLLGIHQVEHLVGHPLYGALFETWVVSECLKGRWHRGLESNLFFWRDRSGLEVDLIIERGQELMPIEIKSGRTVVPEFFRSLQRWRHLADTPVNPVLVYGGKMRQQRGDCLVLPWFELGGFARQL